MRVYACVCVCMQVYTLSVFWLTVGNDHKRSKETLAPSEGIIIWVYWFSALLETVLLLNNVCKVIRIVQFPFFYVVVLLHIKMGFNIYVNLINSYAHEAI